MSANFAGLVFGTVLSLGFVIFIKRLLGKFEKVESDDE